MDQDSEWMQAALDQARLAAAEGEVPVGAVIVGEGRLIAAAHNRTVNETDPTAHAEIVALRLAAAVLNNHRLTDCDLFVTMEPCAMCVGACMQARIRRLVCGTTDPRWGALGSRLDLRLPGLFNHTISFEVGVMEVECRRLLQDFFRERR